MTATGQNVNFMMTKAHTAYQWLYPQCLAQPIRQQKQQNTYSACELNYNLGPYPLSIPVMNIRPTYNLNN